MSKDGFVLECIDCNHRFAADISMGVVAAHFETEHDTHAVRLELVVLCPRCDQAMTYERTVGAQDQFGCQPCHRTRVVTRREP